MQPNKIFIVLKREYLTRVKSKAFILTTLLAPLGIIAIMVLPTLITMFAPSAERTVLLVDETEAVAPRMVQSDTTTYVFTPGVSVSEARDEVLSGNIQGYLLINDDILEGNQRPELVYSGSGGLNFITRVQGDLRQAIREEKLDRAEVGEEVRQIMSERISMSTTKLTETGEEEQDTAVLMFIGIAIGLITYMAMFIYGSIIMRGVIEEKTSRIVEVIVSSLKPIELLTGKVLGVGALALTQFLFWAVAISGLSFVAGLYFVGMGSGAGTAELEAAQAELPFTIPTIGADLIILFLVFFLLGYLIYSALFAAVGSALESESDNQQLTLLVSLPIIIPILFLGTVSADPDSTLSVVLSLIPLFAPILMPVRIAVMSVPFWEIALSLVLLVLTFFALMWLSARIYRVGILMYGKSASLKEIIKWVRYSG